MACSGESDNHLKIDANWTGRRSASGFRKELAAEKGPLPTAFSMGRLFFPTENCLREQSGTFMEEIRQGRSGPDGADILIRPLNGVMMLRNIICKYLIFFQWGETYSNLEKWLISSNKVNNTFQTISLKRETNS